MHLLVYAKTFDHSSERINRTFTVAARKDSILVLPESLHKAPYSLVKSTVKYPEVIVNSLLNLDLRYFWWTVLM